MPDLVFVQAETVQSCDAELVEYFYYAKQSYKIFQDWPWLVWNMNLDWLSHLTILSDYQDENT